jgi:hypothetical protein
MPRVIQRWKVHNNIGGFHKRFDLQWYYRLTKDVSYVNIHPFLHIIKTVKYEVGMKTKIRAQCLPGESR